MGSGPFTSLSLVHEAISLSDGLTTQEKKWLRKGPTKEACWNPAWHVPAQYLASHMLPLAMPPPSAFLTLALAPASTFTPNPQKFPRPVHTEKGHEGSPPSSDLQVLAECLKSPLEM